MIVALKVVGLLVALYALWTLWACCVLAGRADRKEVE